MQVPRWPGSRRCNPVWWFLKHFWSQKPKKMDKTSKTLGCFEALSSEHLQFPIKHGFGCHFASLQLSTISCRLAAATDLPMFDPSKPRLAEKLSPRSHSSTTLHGTDPEGVACNSCWSHEESTMKQHRNMKGSLVTYSSLLYLHEIAVPKTCGSLAKNAQ